MTMEIHPGEQRALTLMARKWSLITIWALFSGTKRLSELQREIPGISQKMLIQTLRELESSGLVERTVHPVVPPHVDYTLTPVGQELRKPLEQICIWGIKHLG